MFYLVLLLIALLCWHTVSYGVYLKKQENNPTAAFGVILLAVLTAVLPMLTWLKLR